MTKKLTSLKMKIMRVYETELISSTRVSGFQIFKFEFCIYNKLCLHVDI